MGIQGIYKQNMEQAMKAASEAEERIKSRSQFGDDSRIPMYEWRDGPNEMRLLWSWAPHGLIGKNVHTHFNIPPERSAGRCPKLTYPGEGKVCHIHTVLDEVTMLRPDLDLRRISANEHIYAHITLPPDDDIVHLVKMTSATFDQILTQQQNPKIGDVTDYLKGFILNIVKTGSGKSTRYAVSFMPGIDPKTDAWAEQVVKQMVDLDTYFKWSEDRERENQKFAMDMKTWLLARPQGEKIGDEQGDDINIGGEETVKTQAKPQAPAAQPQAAPAQTAAVQPAPVQQVAPPVQAATVAEAVEATSGKPACYLSGEHKAECPLCPHELECELNRPS